MANTPYANFILENKLNEKLKSLLSMSQFLTVDTSLEAEDGMTKTIHTYTSTDGVQDVAEGAGNTSDISVSYTSKDYVVTTTQGRFVYSDEAAAKDSFLIDAGITDLAKQIVNDYNHKAIAAVEGTTHVVNSSEISFDDFADAIALLGNGGLEDSEEAGFVALVNPAMKAEIRKNLKDDLQYVEAFVRSGYVGTICGIPVYTSKEVSNNTVDIFSKEAVTAFMKKDTEIEQDRDSNLRTNYVYGRNVKVIALTDERYAAKIVVA